MAVVVVAPTDAAAQANWAPLDNRHMYIAYRSFTARCLLRSLPDRKVRVLERGMLNVSAATSMTDWLGELRYTATGDSIRTTDPILTRDSARRAQRVSIWNRHFCLRR